MSAESRQPSLPLRGSAIRSGVATGASILAVSGAAAVAGAYLAHKFGRDARTDGFLAAYGVYLVIVLAAQAFRLVIVPDLTRAARDERLPAEFVSYASALLVIALPATLVTLVLSHPLGDLLTGTLPPEAASIAARAIVWLVPAAFAQMLAALAALIVGLLCGIVNGSLITMGRLPPFIATLGMMSVARGAALASPGNSNAPIARSLVTIATQRSIGRPVASNTSRKL